MRGWQANKRRTCALPVLGRAMPENEIPPRFTGGSLLFLLCDKDLRPIVFISGGAVKITYANFF